jgi:hypothetical protein
MPTERPAAALTPITHRRLLALAARWRGNPTTNIVAISHDRLIAAGLDLLEAAIPWAELESDPWDALSKVVALLPPMATKAAE